MKKHRTTYTDELEISYPKDLKLISHFIAVYLYMYVHRNFFLYRL